MIVYSNCNIISQNRDQKLENIIHSFPVCDGSKSFHQVALCKFVQVLYNNNSTVILHDDLW